MYPAGYMLVENNTEYEEGEEDLDVVVSKDADGREVWGSKILNHRIKEIVMLFSRISQFFSPIQKGLVFETFLHV
jgi:hypothetical protein